MQTVDLEAWLKRIGLERYAAVFAEHDVDLQILPCLTDNDLKELGLSLGHRRKLLAAIVSEDSVKRKDADVAGHNAEKSEDRPAEWRQVTVMFCDLVGSTELSQRLDAEMLRTIMQDYQEAVAGAVIRFGGHVAKYLGDGVLSIFGWPLAYEDQAERAVRSARTANAAVEAIHDPHLKNGLRLRARFGLATGRVVIGDLVGDAARERDAISGGTPNLAARLQDVAEPGQIVIDGATSQLLGHRFELADIGKQRLKGFSNPIRLWRVVREVKTGSRFEAVYGAALTRFVGREREIAVLLDAWRRVLEGEGRVVVLSGEAGLGKSRLLREFEQSLDNSPSYVLQYQCSPHLMNAAFHPFLESISFNAKFSIEDSREQKLDLLEDYLSPAFDDINEAADTVSGLLDLPTERYGLPEISPQRRKLRAIATFVDYAAGLARKGSLLVLVEDVHWGDPSTLETIDAMVDALQHVPVLIVLTHRPEFERRWDGRDHVTHLSLMRLRKGQCRAIAERVAGNKMLPAEVVDSIVERTDGVPLFIEEITRAILDGDFLIDSGDRYVLSGPLPPLAIPTTLHASLMARLDKLASIKEVIQAASCIGRVFKYELLRSALGISEDDLNRALVKLVDAQLVFRQSKTEGMHFIFKHALIQDAAYESLLSSRRQHIHRRLATILKATKDTEPLILARHFSAAGEPALGAKYYATAGRGLLESCSLPEAIGALELGLAQCELLEDSKVRNPLELMIRLSLGAARMANFGWAHISVSEALEPAFDLAVRIENQQALGPILWGLWVHYQTRTEFATAHKWLARLEDITEQNLEGDLPVVRDMSAGCQYFWEAHYERARRYTKSLQSIYQPTRHGQIATYANHDPLCFALHWAGALLEWITGYPDRSLEHLEIAVDRARELGHPFNCIFSLTAGASNLLYLGLTERLLAYCEEAETISEQEALGAFTDHVMIMQWRGAAQIWQGQCKNGYELVRAGNDYWNSVGGRICNAMFQSWIAVGHFGCGRTHAALSLINSTIDHCRQTGDRYMEPECLRLRAEFMAAGKVTQKKVIKEQLSEAIEVARSHKAKSWELRSVTSLAILHRNEGNDAEARALLTPVVESFTEGLSSSDMKAALTLLGQL